MQRKAERGTHELRCAREIRNERLAGDSADPPVSVIRDIAEEIRTHCGHSRLKAHRLARGWTVDAAVGAFHNMCHRQELGTRGLSSRSWLEWEAGSSPNADYQDLLCRLFRCGPVQLGFARDYSPTPRNAPRDVGPGTALPKENSADVDLRETTAFARRVATSAINQVTLDELDNEIMRLARYYVSQPLAELLVEIRDLRQHIFGLIENNRHPDQIRHLYLIASRVCGLQTHTALDLGNYVAADAQARTARLCADLAGHNDSRAWVRATQSLIAYWDGRLAEAVEYARDGAPYAASGTVSVRLPSLEARACAALGDRDGALDALHAAERARECSSLSTGEIGGVFTFPAAKQAVYAGTTRLALDERGQTRRAIADSQQAIDLYQSRAPQDQSSGDLLAAHLDLASACLSGDDLDGTRTELDMVMGTPPERRTASIMRRAGKLRTTLSTRRYQQSPLARQMDEQIAVFCAPPPALPAEKESPDE